MKLKRWVAVLLCISLVLSLTGCKKDEKAAAPAQTQPVVTEAPAVPAGELYSAARAAVDNAADLTLRVAVETNTQVGNVAYQETSNQVVNYLDRGTDALKLLRSEVVSYGEMYSVTYQDVYADGKLYTLVNGESRFACGADAASCEADMVPAVLLDASLYGSMEAEKTAGKTVITFSQSAAAESWALPQGAEFLEGSGTAVVNEDGSLYKTTYTVSYTYGAAQITQVYSVLPELESAEIPVPADAEKYAVLDNLWAVRLSQQACGRLLQTPLVSSDITETMASLAAGLVRTETTSVDMYFGNDYISSVDTSVNVVNYTSGESETNTQSEKFHGVYTISENGGEAKTDASVDGYTFWQYTTEKILDGMTVLDYWTNAGVKDLGDLYLVECTFNGELASALRGDICQTILGDARALDSYSTQTTVTAVNGYFAVDKYTGLPTAASYTYTGSDVLNGETYVIAVQKDQSYTVPNEDVYYDLTGETLAEEEPETKATPLLYHITGADGQEMYLMGTIHVGDERMAYLPQEIYDALNDSAALAVEFDVLDFEEKLKTDADLQAEIAAISCYTDGTTVVDHADQELLAAAEEYMKATGNYSSSLSMMKPAFWANTLENSYLRQSYSLSSAKGADRCLIQAADNSGKMVIDIESGKAQMAMMGSYSDELQELLLKEAISYEPGECWQGVAELYEMWCLGDEAQLRQLLNDTSDLADLSAEEQALYQEYQKAMITDRNTAMLDEAVNYLESGHTIFYAVGLAHLLQDNGLVDGLRDAGYTVEQVLYQ